MLSLTVDIAIPYLGGVFRAGRWVTATCSPVHITRNRLGFTPHFRSSTRTIRAQSVALNLPKPTLWAILIVWTQTN